MKQAALILITAAMMGAAPEQIFTGVITDSMCGSNHKMMNISPDSKCTRECAKTSGVKYALNDGRNIYKLSDQATPAQFAGQKVRVTGTLFTKTGIIQVNRIEPAK